MSTLQKDCGGPEFPPYVSAVEMDRFAVAYALSCILNLEHENGQQGTILIKVPRPSATESRL